MGLGATLDYVQRIGLANIARHEHELLDYATTGLRTVQGLKLFGSAREKVSVLSSCSMPSRQMKSARRSIKTA